MAKLTNVLIADDIEQECVDHLRKNNIDVTIKTKLPKDELIAQLKQHDAVIVRSATKLTAEILDASAGRLKLIGRAGTGVDNIHVPTASKHKILVMNTPQGNSRSAAELTSILLVSLSRQVPQAHSSMKAGKWARKDFMGEEMFGRTLAIIGLGRIGREVAVRLQAWGMRVVAFDPLVSTEDAKSIGVELLTLEQIWPIADYITVHVPLIPATENLINAQVLAKCKKGVRIVNVARGGIVNEEDLVAALDAGQVAGAAFDVFREEPPVYRGIVDHPRVICTPHLGASTIDAQVRVATEIAENFVAFSEDKGTPGAINAKDVL